MVVRLLPMSFSKGSSTRVLDFFFFVQIPIVETSFLPCFWRLLDSYYTGLNCVILAVTHVPVMRVSQSLLKSRIHQMILPDTVLFQHKTSNLSKKGEVIPMVRCYQS